MSEVSLSICLFGPHLFRLSGHPYALALRGTTLDLLRFLVVNMGREIRRECIADQFWRRSSGSRQRSALNSAVWRIGKKLPDHPGISLCATGSTICLAVDHSVSVDTHRLTELVRQGARPEGMDKTLAEELSEILNASEAPFMDGVTGDWVLSEQERVFNMRLRGLTQLMHWHGDEKHYEDALEFGRRLLIADPFREAAQIDVMWLYVLNGQRAQALRHYQHYAELLARELDIEPMAETRALYDYILCDLNCQRRARDLPRGRSGDLLVQRQSLNAKLAAIEQSRRDLYQALRSTPR